jgi:hypothetical protein
MARPTSTYTSKDSEIALLKEKLAMLENTSKPEESGDRIFKPEEYILVMSLLPHTLNLSTQVGGQGSIKKFTKFGETKRILYRDLVEIMEVNSSFVEAGYFYIMDSQLIRYHGLNDVYEKILSKEKIEQILEADSDICVDLYTSANPRQQEIIVNLLIEKTINDQFSVNLSIIDKISRLSKVDIYKKAQETASLRKEMKEEQ